MSVKLPRTTINELRQVNSTINANKYYQTYVVHDLQDEHGEMYELVAFHWGRIGAAGQWQSGVVKAGAGDPSAQRKLDTKLKGGYSHHSTDHLDVIPDEVQKFLPRDMAGNAARNESLDLTTMLVDAQQMTVDLIEGKATAADVALLTDRAKRATHLHEQLQGRLSALQMLVMSQT